MPEPFPDIIETLEHVAAYEGPWRQLRRETPLLQTRVAELRAREARRDEVLVVALVGGSGVGKSTLLNAIAGDELAKTSAMRPCTAIPTVYHPPGATEAFEGWRRVSGSALENLVLIDTPDSDTILREHREEVRRVLEKCDLVLLCGSSEKYLDEATWSLLRPLQRERTFVCVETKATHGESVREHWMERLHAQDFDVAGYFRVNGLRTFDRKLSGAAPGPEELDFPKLEHFLREELSGERIRRIKRSNTAGLVMKTVGQLHERLEAGAPQLDALGERLHLAEAAVREESLLVVQDRLFTEPHLWAFALGREISLRAKGIVGTLFRAVEALRSLPARMAGWLPRFGRGGAGRQAASLLSTRELFQDDLHIATEEVALRHHTHQSEVALALARADFDPVASEDGADQFRGALDHRVSEVLRGPARDTLARYARGITNWPMTVLFDLPPLLFLVYGAFIIVRSYFLATVLPVAFLVHSLAVLAIILATELLLLSILARILAWRARKQAASALRAAFARQPLAFEPERTALGEASDALNRVRNLHQRLR